MTVRCPECGGDFEVEGMDYTSERRILDTTEGCLDSSVRGACVKCGRRKISYEYFLRSKWY